MTTNIITWKRRFRFGEISFSSAGAAIPEMKNDETFATGPAGIYLQVSSNNGVDDVVAEHDLTVTVNIDQELPSVSDGRRFLHEFSVDSYRLEIGDIDGFLSFPVNSKRISLVLQHDEQEREVSAWITSL